MDKHRLRVLADNPNHIQGIYNYCDRWCERCQFTSKCLLYATEKEDEDLNDPETYDIQNEKFWNKIHESFQLTLELIRDEAEKMGIDLDNIPEDPEETLRQEEQIKRIEKHPLIKKAHNYFNTVHDWLDKSQPLFEKKEDELNETQRMELEGEDPLLDAINITDATEVIKWYFMQIQVKLSRAFSSREMDELEGFDDDEDILNDGDGSAKVALLGIDRSIAAWGALIRYFPEEENNILDFLVILEQLRKGVEKEFPKARGFKRPGFDD
ncbi:MAG: hypothetical protein KDC05_04735 [Bacteroidales bacterium]|nr:hypothetical protein [Bacteroidales bacterium]